MTNGNLNLGNTPAYVGDGVSKPGGRPWYEQVVRFFCRPCPRCVTVGSYGATPGGRTGASGQTPFGS